MILLKRADIAIRDGELLATERALDGDVGPTVPLHKAKKAPQAEGMLTRQYPWIHHYVAANRAVKVAVL